jgi:hypothetical protein
MFKNMQEKIEFVNEFEPYYKKFEKKNINGKEKLFYIDIEEEEVKNLSILIEYEDKNSLIFKYGEYEQLLPILKEH